MATAPHPTRIVRFNLMAALLGVSFPFAVQGLHDDYSPDRLIATIAFMLTALNFFHGKVVTLEDEDYNRALIDRPTLALADYVLNLIVVLAFVFMAFCLKKPKLLLVSNIVLRVSDLVLTLLIRRVSHNSLVIRAQTMWLTFNSVSLAYFLLLAWRARPVDNHPHFVAWSFLILTIADIIIDYAYNRKLYFSMTSSWDELAKLWDAVQGRTGDIYRQQIILPAIRKVSPPEGRRFLDAGCGTGAIARSLAEQGASVIACDRSLAMLELARSYRVPRVDYRQVDMETEREMLSGGPVDVALAIFSLQDTETIAAPLRWLAEQLHPNGTLLIVFEQEIVANTNSHSTTRRRWLDSARLAGRGRRQLIFWEPNLLMSVQAAPHRAGEISKDGEHFTTVTRQWSSQSYQIAAEQAGLRFTDATVLDAEDSDREAPTPIRYYRMAPRFVMLRFTRPAAAEPETVLEETSGTQDPAGTGNVAGAVDETKPMEST